MLEGNLINHTDSHDPLLLAAVISSGAECVEEHLAQGQDKITQIIDYI